MKAMTPQEADAATLRGLGERMQARGEDGMAEITFQVARWCEECVPLPLDLVQEALAPAKAKD